VRDASNFRKDVRLHPEFKEGLAVAMIAEDASKPGGRNDCFRRKDADYFGLLDEEGGADDIGDTPSLQPSHADAAD
jgi:hypothetical protein